MSSSKLHQDTTTGKLVEVINIIDKEFAKVKEASGNITYIHCDQLVPYSKEKGRLAKVSGLKKDAKIEEDKIPDTVVPQEDVRLNMNMATPEQIAKRLPGVGYATAKRIVELRMSLSGERFANLKQLENIPRVNWEAIIEEDLIFIN